VSTIGRDESCTVVVDDPGASRRHAEIRITHDGPHLQVILRDLSSTNGTYLNGEQVGSEELRAGDRITVGRTHLTVELET
jgi:pSer/pThr/pTyr-binding forkhead associated (FHA) protein